ncbi:MAG TPA: helix-turn-helix transcriptional regulator [Ktedonobacteraceae bacterium]|jgi:transcriptional regulator with XRE-family HTH domain|nr:helix-turn-helix transcriptional regulator [Ktedonobacteraceae bacterium]
MASSESFSSILKAYRKNNGLSQEELARRLHFSKETISAWERGKRKPHPLQIARLAQVLQKDAQALTQSLYPDYPAASEFKSHESPGARQQENSLITMFASQDECEALIRHEARHATQIKVLTIRGEKYFLGPRSILYHLCDPKHPRNCSIQVLVLSPESSHITQELAIKLGHDSAQRIREKMNSVLGYLKFLMNQNNGFEIRCYQETPIFKILMFDNVMFVSSFAGGGPKNDRNARMFRLIREGNPLFMGLESYFDQLWLRSARPL